MAKNMTRRDRVALANQMRAEQVAASPADTPRRREGGTPPSAAPSVASAPHVNGDTSAGRARPLEEYPDLMDVLPELCDRYREIQVEVKALEEERQSLSLQIMPLLEAVGAESVAGDSWVVSRTKGSRSTIVPELLLKEGVTTDQIAAATRKVEYFYIQLRERK